MYSKWRLVLLLALAIALGESCAATPNLSPSTHPTIAPYPTELAPTPTPTITPTPGERLAAADRLLTNGEYAEAIAQYQTLLTTASDVVQERAWLHLGLAFFRAGDYPRAVETLQGFVAHYPSSTSLSRALVTLARTYESLGQWLEAAGAWTSALPLEPDIAAYLYSRLGDALIKGGDDAAAMDAYALAAKADAPLSLRVLVLENMGDALRRLERYSDAIAAYNAILAEARRVPYRASISYKIGLAEYESGQTDSAFKRWLDIMENYPDTWAAYTSLQELVARNARLPGDLTQGIVYYHAGQYDEAIAALRRYIWADLAGHLGDAHYYAGLSFFRRGEYEKALREFDYLIETHPRNELVPQGWLEKARTLATMGRTEDAVRAYRHFAALYPAHPQAEDALWRAAALASDCVGAQEAYRDLIRAYPEGAHVAEAWFRDGMCAYTASDWPQAMSIWQQALSHAPTDSEKARLLFWLGKAALGAGEREDAEAYWMEAVAADSEGHYGRRAKDELQGSVWVGTPLEPSSAPSAYQRRGQRDEAEAWLASWLGVGEEKWGDLPSDVVATPAFRRAEALLRVGLRDEAIEEYRTVLASAWSQPRTLYSLALYFDERELYRLSTSAAERLLQLTPRDQTPPRFLLELAYPTPFADLVLPKTAAAGVDPLLFYALMRQESRFDPEAKSSSGAIGLTQVMPATGEWIARQLGEKGFTTRDLYRPVISVSYGMYYLVTALQAFEDDPFRALVAYNAGLSNARRWSEAFTPFDRDLFYEELPAEQAQAFVREIYRQYAAYRLLYGPGG
ncbi:MAG: tetratricopeptide repeat protein [Chloroflexi bacterium]|nr:tetratricopeptide repeat protein [Chloroflexota bacterium]